MASPGRPPEGQYVTVQHLDTGAVLSWADGVFTGDRDLAAAARLALDAYTGETITIGTRALLVEPITARGVAPAMLRACTGRGIIRDASFTGSLSLPRDTPDTGTLALGSVD